jgi:tetratricopeptide (TPR) repeat protein
MRSTFYIHIGVHKTGTKSIQQTLSANRGKLLPRGINYLPGDPNHGPVLISLLSDSPHEDLRNIRRHVDTPEKAASYNASAKHRITQALSRNKSPKIVISGEGLSSRPRKEVERLKQLLAPYAAAYRIIVYVRDPYEYSNSASLQRVKSGSALDIADREIPLPKYRRKLEKFIQVFGRENIDIRIFDPQRFVGGDLIPDFLSALGESAELAKSLEIVRANGSMSHEAALILSETNAAVPAYINGRANRARAFGFHLYVADIVGEKFSIDPHRYTQHEAEILADIAWLARTMGEPVFGRSSPRPASEPRWSKTTVGSVMDVLTEMAARIQQLNGPAPGPVRRSLRKLLRHLGKENTAISRVLTRPIRQCFPLPVRMILFRISKSRQQKPNYEIVIPAGLEWLEDAVRQPSSARSETMTIPNFDGAMIRSVGCFMHHLALTIQHLQAERFAREGRLLIWVSRRAAERHYREVVRLDPANASGQYRLSQAHWLLGHFVPARKAAEAAARLAPGRAAFRRWLRLVQAIERWRFKPPAASVKSEKRKPPHAPVVRNRPAAPAKRASRRDS